MLEVFDLELACSNPKEINIFKIKRHKLFFPQSFIQLINPFLLILNLYKNRKFLKNNNFKSVIINTPIASHFLRLTSIGLNVNFIYFVHGYRFHSKGNYMINTLIILLKSFYPISQKIYQY